jgi:hypothetical protein
VDEFGAMTTELAYRVRLSRTAQGVRTYTVEMSAANIEQDAVTKLFELEQAVISEIDGPHASAKRSGSSLAAQLRRTMILNVLRQSGDWLNTAAILKGAAGAVRSRSQLVADLAALTRDGYVEYEAGGNGRGNVSRYRVSAEGRKRA